MDGAEVNPKVVSKTLLDIQKNMLAINTSRVKMAGALQAATEALTAKEEQLSAREVALAAAQRRIQELGGFVFATVCSACYSFCQLMQPLCLQNWKMTV
jgi:cytochrome c5